MEEVVGPIRRQVFVCLNVLGVKLQLPIQMTVLYLCTILVAASAEFFGWAPEIRVYNTVPYGMLCFYTLEATRFIQKFRYPVIGISNIPLFTSCSQANVHGTLLVVAGAFRTATVLVARSSYGYLVGVHACN